MGPKKMKPEISLEFKDVSIEIKVCGMDLMPEDREFIKFFPELDSNLTSREQVDNYRRFNKKERKKIQKFEYKLVPNHAPAAKEAVVKVLPKLSCQHCGKTFSRRSTLEQHVASHDQFNTSWEDVQDEALKDLEAAITFGNIPGMVLPPGTRRDSNASTRRESTSSLSVLCTSDDYEIEEQEIPPPQNIKSTPGSSQAVKSEGHTVGPDVPMYQCDRCEAKYRDVGNLKRHIWARHINSKKNINNNNTASTSKSAANGQTPASRVLFTCPHCKRKFGARAHLDRHLPVHNNMEKPFECDICGWKFHLQHNMERHKSTHEKGKKAKVPPHLRDKINPSSNNGLQKLDKTKDLTPSSEDTSNSDSIMQESSADDSNIENDNEKVDSEKDATEFSPEKLDNEKDSTVNSSVEKDLNKSDESSRNDLEDQDHSKDAVIELEDGQNDDKNDDEDAKNETNVEEMDVAENLSDDEEPNTSETETHKNAATDLNTSIEL